MLARFPLEEGASKEELVRGNLPATPGRQLWLLDG